MSEKAENCRAVQEEAENAPKAPHAPSADSAHMSANVNVPAVVAHKRPPPARATDGGTLAPGGGSLNPGGRPAALRDLVGSIRARSPELVQRLFEIALKGNPNAPTTVRAAEVLLERGYGRAPVTIEDADGNRMRVGIVILPAERGDGEL